MPKVYLIHNGKEPVTTTDDPCKVDVPKSNTTKMWTPIFEWYVVRYGSTN